MTGAAVLSLAATVALPILMLALLVGVVRILSGPTLADRVLALDLITVTAMSVVGTLAVVTGVYLVIDIALALALVSFLATVAFARYILSRSRKEKDQ